MVWLFNGKPNVVGYLMPTLFKTILVEEKLPYYLTNSWKDKGVHIFCKGIRQKVNVIARLEFELANYEFAVKHVSHNAKGYPPLLINTRVP